MTEPAQHVAHAVPRVMTPPPVAFPAAADKWAPLVIPFLCSMLLCRNKAAMSRGNLPRQPSEPRPLATDAWMHTTFEIYDARTHP